MNCIRFGASLSGPWLNLALTLTGNVAYTHVFFPHFSKFESGRCQRESSHIELRTVQSPTQSKIM